MRSRRQSYAYEVFAGSKPLAWAWLAAVATLGGALGGTLASGTLWRSLAHLPLWPVAATITGVMVRRATLAVSGSALAFLATWCFFWSLLAGVVAMWAAQRAGSGGAYGVASGFGFLLGIVQGVYEPEDLESKELCFGVSMVGAPLGACAATWLHRNLIGDPSSLAAAAITGAVAGTLFLGPAMAVLLAGLNNVQSLKRLGSLLLHRDETAVEAVPVLNTAMALAPQDDSLLDRRALAYALAGQEAAAEADWARHQERRPKSSAPATARGWVHLRRGRSAEAVSSFGAALASSKRARLARVGLGVARMRSGDASGAVESLSAIPGKHLDALSLTYLAEAHLASGNPNAAAQAASDAIDELDSIFARTWLVRGEARRALGDIDGAARDFNKAWHVADEEGIQDRALAGLDAIRRPLDEDEREDGPDE
jgi:tetratricopeptide (TPR) repeat protein